MLSEGHTDYQRFADGSKRWLWQIVIDGRLWRAGVEHRLDAARRVAEASWELYYADRAAVLVRPTDRLRESPFLDLDALDRDDDATPDPAA